MNLPTSPVFRQVTFPVPVFDHIKDTQRKLQALTGKPLTLNQAITAIAMEHKALIAERGVRKHETETVSETTTAR